MTSFSGLFDHVQASPRVSVQKGVLRRKLTRLFKRQGYRMNKELINTLINGAVGDYAFVAHSRVEAHDNENHGTLGGVRPIERFVDIDRNTNAVDASDITNAITDPTSDVFVDDKSGNGGGGQLGR